MSNPELLRFQADRLLNGLSRPDSIEDLQRLAVTLARRSLNGTRPEAIPEYLLHISQVDIVSRALLQHLPPEYQEFGRRLAWTHDIGRAVDMGAGHPYSGAYILRQLGFDEVTIHYALAHHRWGIGERGIAKADFAGIVHQALENGTVDTVFSQIASDDTGLVRVAVLLADNSKKPVAPGSFIPQIAMFTLDQGKALIEAQMARGRFNPGSERHMVEMTGMYALLEMVPLLERELRVAYEAAIETAQENWPQDEAHVVALWNEIAYHEPHDDP